jgi:hypothetical protein
MRAIYIFLPALAALAAFAPTPSHADPYRWCAVYGGRGGGGSNCGFITWDQCMATVSGIGGFCEPNQFYTGPDRASGSDRRSTRKRYQNQY